MGPSQSVAVVCVCVCVTEKGREKGEREREAGKLWFAEQPLSRGAPASESQPSAHMSGDRWQFPVAPPIRGQSCRGFCAAGIVPTPTRCAALLCSGEEAPSASSGRRSSWSGRRMPGPAVVGGARPSPIVHIPQPRRQPADMLLNARSGSVHVDYAAWLNLFAYSMFFRRIAGQTTESCPCQLQAHLIWRSLRYQSGGI